MSYRSGGNNSSSSSSSNVNNRQHEQPYYGHHHHHNHHGPSVGRTDRERDMSVGFPETASFDPAFAGAAPTPFPMGMAMGYQTPSGFYPIDYTSAAAAMAYMHPHPMMYQMPTADPSGMFANNHGAVSDRNPLPERRDRYRSPRRERRRSYSPRRDQQVRRSRRADRERSRERERQRRERRSPVRGRRRERDNRDSTAGRGVRRESGPTERTASRQSARTTTTSTATKTVPEKSSKRERSSSRSVSPSPAPSSPPSTTVSVVLDASLSPTGDPLCKDDGLSLERALTQTEGFDYDDIDRDDDDDDDDDDDENDKYQDREPRRNSPDCANGSPLVREDEGKDQVADTLCDTDVATVPQHRVGDDGKESRERKAQVPLEALGTRRDRNASCSSSGSSVDDDKNNDGQRSERANSGTRPDRDRHVESGDKRRRISTDRARDGSPSPRVSVTVAGGGARRGRDRQVGVSNDSNRSGKRTRGGKTYHAKRERALKVYREQCIRAVRDNRPAPPMPKLIVGIVARMLTDRAVNGAPSGGPR